MADLDPNVSNGTCYFDSNKQATDSYIPCGNAAYGNFQCCQEGDHCLENSACFNGKFGVTYLAGCTDSDYSDSVCPYKGDFSNQQWVGLVRCFVSNNTGTTSEEWAPCEDKSQPQLAQPEQCSCNAKAHTAIITAGTALPDIAILPITRGDHISFFPGHEPTQTVLLSTKAPSSATATTTFGTSSLPSLIATSTSSASTSSKSLSTQGKVGIGVGVTGGVLLALALCAIFFLLRRRKRKEEVPPIEDQIRPYSYNQTLWENAATNQSKDPPDMRSPAWSGHKSELPADASTMTSRSSTPHIDHKQYQYQAYNPYRHKSRPDVPAVVEMPGREEQMHEIGDGLSTNVERLANNVSGKGSREMRISRLQGEQDWSSGNQGLPKEPKQRSVFELPA